MREMVDEGYRMALAGELSDEAFAALRTRISEAINNTESFNERQVMEAVSRGFVRDFVLLSGAEARQAYAASYEDEEVDDG